MLVLHGRRVHMNQEEFHQCLFYAPFQMRPTGYRVLNGSFQYLVERTALSIGSRANFLNPVTFGWF